MAISNEVAISEDVDISYDVDIIDSVYDRWLAYFLVSMVASVGRFLEISSLASCIQFVIVIVLYSHVCAGLCMNVHVV